MKSTVIKVSAVRGKQPNSPLRLKIQGHWLRDIGFEEGKQYRIEHNAERILARLDDSTIQQKPQYKPYLSPRKVKLILHKECGWVPYIDFDGHWLYELGFEIGGQALIQYEYGVIVWRPLFTGNATAHLVSTRPGTVGDLPKIRLSGAWLDACGFTPKKMALLEHEYGTISLRLRGEGQADYLVLAKSILKSRKGSIAYVTSECHSRTKKYRRSSK